MEQNIITQKVFPFPTKETQKEFADKLVRMVEDGEVSPLEMAVKTKAVVETFKAVGDSKVLKDAVYNESLKYGKGEQMAYGGAKVQVKEGGVKYDFSVCGDPEWDELNRQMEELKAKMKEKEDWLKGNTKPITVLDEATGEVSTIYPPARTSVTTFSITFPKQ